MAAPDEPSLGERSSPDHANPITALLRLQRRIYRVDSVLEASYVIVNETAQLLPYDQAALFSGRGKRMKLERQSHVSEVDRTAPAVRWLQHLAGCLASDHTEAKQLQIHDVAESLRNDWPHFASTYGLWLPLLVNAQGGVERALLLMRAQSWKSSEIALLKHLALTYGHVLGKREGRKRFRIDTLRNWWWLGGVAMVVTIAALIPVRLSVLAPAEVTPRDPWIISAPSDGVVKRIEVGVNETVLEGQLLGYLDDHAQRAELHVSQSALALAEAQLHRARQSGFADKRHRSTTAELEAEVRLRETELARAQMRLQRMQLHAGASGLVVIDRPQEWQGRPVRVGERIGLVVQPERVELTLWLGVHDAIEILPGARVDLFMDSDPTKKIDAEVVNIGHEPQRGFVGQMAYRVQARLPDSATPRLGLRGVAKIYGEEVSLLFYLFRRPLIMARQWLGW